MPRIERFALGGVIFHVMNWANNRDNMFESPEDFLACLRVMRDTLDKKRMRILSYCLIENQSDCYG